MRTCQINDGFFYYAKNKKKGEILIRKLLLCFILVLCLPLQSLAARSAPSVIGGGKNKTTADEQNDRNDTWQQEKENESEDRTKPPEERQEAADVAGKIATQNEAVQIIRNHDSQTREQADSSSSQAIIGDGTNTNAVAGFIGGTSENKATAFRISLAKLDNETFAATGDFDAYANAIQDYGSRYYVACEGGAYYYPSNKGCALTNRGKPAVSVPSGSISQSILNCLFNDTTGEYVSARTSGSKFIDLDENELSQLMSELSQIDSYNMALYQEWLSGETSQPIVAVVEVAGLSINGRHSKDSKSLAWVSVADCAYEIGETSGYEAFLSTDISGYTTTPVASKTIGGRMAAQSDAAIAALTPMLSDIKGSGRDEHNWWPYFYTKHMFGTWWPSGVCSDSTLPEDAPGQNRSSWSLWAEQLKQTKSKSIVGCTMFTLRPSTGGVPTGTFDWHIDAEGLPLNSSGHAEDTIVSDTGGSSTKHCTVGSVSLYNENWRTWQWYLSENNVDSVTLRIGTYFSGQGRFTMDYDKLLGNPGGGMFSRSIVVEEKSYDTANFIAMLRNEDATIPVVSNDILGPKEDGSLRVSYAMTINVVLPDGQVIPLTNEDVHWAIYGTDEGRTFKFQQIAGDAYAQIKQGELDNVSYEAMAGTPTTEDLFISMGGEQYVVNMQYRYVEDDYIRTYECETEETPNLTYYKIGDAFTVTKSSEKRKEDSTRRDQNSSPVWETDPYSEYSTAREEQLKAAKIEFYEKLKGLEIDTNNETYGSYYSDCIASVDDLAARFKGFLDSLTEASQTQDSADVILFKGTDPDTGEQFEIKARIAFTSDCSDVEMDSTPSTTYPGFYDHHYAWKAEYKLELVYEYGGDQTLSAECRTSEKNLSDTVTIQQTFENVKYMDILEAHVWQLKEGREVGVGELLAAPVSSADEVLKLAVEQLGYTYYDSEQTQNRGWEEHELRWRCISASDLEETGRLVNSYNTGMDQMTEGQYFNGDEHAFKLISTGDTVKFLYTPSEQGGRSHRSFYSFIAQAAARTFYDRNTGLPYANTILCTSDILALQAGDAHGSDWIAFCGFEFNTADYTAVDSLKQYILAPDSEVLRFTTSDFSKDGRNLAASQGTDIKPIFDSACAYLEGVVTLNNDQAYSEYSRQTLCVDSSVAGAFSFVGRINEKDDMPRIGYRGNYQTESVEHAAVNYSKGQGFDPGIWSCFTGVMDSYREGVTGKAVANVPYEGQMPSAEYAFPYDTGLNVIRTLTNGQYKTGHACLVYDKPVSRYLENVPEGVVPVVLYDNYKTGVERKLVTARENPKGMYLDADYADHWETVNDIVIFNPSSAEYSNVIPLSKYLPDAQNNDDTDYTTNPERDQRVNGTYVNGTYTDKVFKEGQIDTSDIGQIVTSTHYELKERSDLPTDYYRYDSNDAFSDYTYTETENTYSSHIKFHEENETSHITTMEGDYTITMANRHGMPIAIRKHLEANEVIYSNGEALFMKGRPEVVTFAQVLENSGLSVDTDVIKMDSGSSLFIDLHELGKLKKGEVIHVSLTFGEKYNPTSKPFSVYINDGIHDAASADDSDNPENATPVKVVSSSEDGMQWNFYLELQADTTINRMQIVADANLTLVKTAEPILKFEDMFLMAIGNDIAFDSIVEMYAIPGKCNTLGYLYKTNSAYYYVRGLRCYNALTVSYSITTGVNTTTIMHGDFYVDAKATSAVFSLKASALNNPHKVWNSNWRYYVVGWTTTSGARINSPDDNLLSIDATVLNWPSGNGTVSVADLKAGSCLVMYNGNVYLTLMDDGKNHVISQIGATVTSYDLFSLGDATNTVTLASNPAIYPLSCGQSASGSPLHSGDKYEFFFRLSDTNGYLFDVQYATNNVYRYRVDNIEYTHDAANVKQNWEYDWTKIETKTKITTEEFANGGISNYLSLDDGFSISYQNIGNFKGNDALDIPDVQNVLGYGWENNMDVSKWIYQKWVTFDMDVFMFDPVDSSVEYQNRNGLYFYPAGSIIPLGLYEGDNGDADNDGHWIDYGATSDYKYHFWVSLSNGEQREAVTDFATLNINSIGEGANTGNMEPSNKDLPSPPLRYANARRYDYTDVVGRIGGLTMVDTEDYRWSNTFKTYDPSAAWLVQGLIRRLESYSNEHGIPSTQKTIVTDPFDVRGRLGITSMLEKIGYSTDTYALYKGQLDSMNTYGTQWHKDLDKLSAVHSLPLVPEYNESKALRMTELKLGYKSLMSLETIGNYYGNALDESEDGNGLAVNLNDDYGNEKVQIRPVYIAITQNADGSITSRAVDVYMKQNGSYVKINAGDANVSGTISTLVNNEHLMYLTTNTGTYTDPDQNLMRRMTTQGEAEITSGLLTKYATDTTSLLTPVQNTSLTADLAPTYTYGNGQYMFLRERNRTFVGKSSQALRDDDVEALDGFENAYDRYNMNAQKYYFDIGLPSSAIFVEQGMEPHDGQITMEHTYILVTLEVYVRGEVWMLQYKSPISHMDIQITPDDPAIEWEKWNPIRDTHAWLIPVATIDVDDTTSSDDLNTTGTH